MKGGSSDVEYDKYCRDNNMQDLTDFNGESTSEITLIVEQPYRGRVLKFRCVYDSHNDENFNEVNYFGTVYKPQTLIGYVLYTLLAPLRFIW